MDDLQFQLEEQGVISGDQLESATETNVQQVKSLTAELERERKLTQQLRDQLKVSKCVAKDYKELYNQEFTQRNSLEQVEEIETVCTNVCSVWHVQDEVCALIIGLVYSPLV